MGGDSAGTAGSWLPGPGNHSIRVIEYDGPNATGSILFEGTLNLTVNDALQHRMRTVRLETGLPNALVHIRMQQHAFPFGSMVKASNNPDVQIYERDSYDERMYQDTFLANFNASVAGNAMKWYTQQPDWWSGSPHNQDFATPGQHRYDVADNILGFLESENIPMRGHTIYWGEIGGSKETPENQMQDPNWVEALGTDALYWMEQRAKSIVGRYAGRIDEWDFNNELWHGDWYRRTFGTWITKQMAEWALEANPDIKLWFNEYAMLSSNSNAVQFKQHLEKLISEGVPVDGVGVQAHFSSLPDAATVKASLDILDDLGRPIKLTEFDCGWNGASEAQEANGLEIVYRTAFEHPSVEGIIMWGFWEGNHWKPERALWLTDWTPTQQALRYRDLVFNEWWTDATVVTSPDGSVEFALFAGDYAFEIDGTIINISISAGSEPANLQLTGGALSIQENLEVMLKRPVNGNTYARNQAVEFLADVQPGASPVEQVEFYANGTLLKRDTVAPYTALWTSPPDGESNVQAVARDANGNEHASKIHSIKATWGD
jgi:GH35 family endo-1,4-beta-xylanase